MKKLLFVFLIIFIFNSIIRSQFFSNRILIDSNTIFSTYTDVASGDIDNDSLNDIIIDYNGLSWLKNLGSGSFSSPNSLDSSLNTSVILNIYIKDLNNDGYNDIITAIYGGEIRCCFNNGAGSFAQSIQIDTVSDGCKEVFFIDFDNDNDLDLFYCGGQIGSAGSPEIGWIENYGNGTFASKIVVEYLSNAGWSYEGVECADIDNDGDVDIIASQYSIYNTNLGIVWFENNGSGFNSRQNIFIDSSSSTNNLHGFYHLNIGHLNTDNYLDIVVSTLDSTFWLKNLGNGNYEHKQLINSSNYSFKPIISDFNSDGKNDILLTTFVVAANPDPAKLILLSNIGLDMFSTNLIDSVPNVRYPSINDFDNDGDIDVVVISKSEGIILYNNLNISSSISTYKTSYYVNIFPNPTNDLINLEIEGYNGSFNVEIYDLQGRLLETTKSRTVSLKKYSKGMYLFRVSYGDKTEEVRVLRQ